MTYKELYDKALWDLEHNRITLGEFEEVTEPLNKEIPKEEQTDGDLISRQAVLNKIKEVCFSKEWVQFRVDYGSNGQRDFLINYIEQLPPSTLQPSAKKIDGDLITKIDKLPRIKVGNSNSPTVKYCIDEVLLYDLLERYKAEKTAEWIKQKSGDELFPEEIVCSKCYHSNSHLDFDEHNNPIGKVFLESKYCPNCGRKMKVVEE